MIRILLYGVLVDNNFGGPSIIHGIEELVKEIHDDYEIICYQSSEPNNISISDMNIKIIKNPYSSITTLLIDAIKFKFGIKPKNNNYYILLKNIKNSDIIVNIFGICFCGDFYKGTYSYLKSIKLVLGKFSLNFIAKIYHKRSVKSTASYGPMTTKNTIIEARFACKHIFDIIYAREKESMSQIIAKAKIRKAIPVSPDIANYMRYDSIKDNESSNFICISISYQIIKQWKSLETYIECIEKLIKHIIEEYEYRVVLIPNEYTPENSYNDIHVANEIHSLLDYSSYVTIPDVLDMNSTQIKNLIASSEVIIASRYHSCVAALSAGVPTLVVGWHYKYEELLKLYGQERWIISNEDCTSNNLISLFDMFWENRNNEREVITEKYKIVKNELINAAKNMFNK